MKPALRSPWWLLVALLLGLQAGLLLRPVEPRPTQVLLPLLPLSGAELEAELVARGLMLPPVPPGELDGLGERLAEGLGSSAWLGPTLSVDDFIRGVAALEDAGLPSSEQQRVALQPELERLRALRGELDRSQRRMGELASELACAREALLQELDPATRMRLLTTAPPREAGR